MMLPMEVATRIGPAILRQADAAADPESQRTPAAEPTFTGPAILRSVTMPPGLVDDDLAAAGNGRHRPAGRADVDAAAAGLRVHRSARSPRDDIAAVGLQHGFAADLR